MPEAGTCYDGGMSIIVALYFLPTIIRDFALGLLIVAAFAVLAHAQTSTTNCFKNGAGTVCETRDAQGRTSARTTCWPQGNGQTCQTQDYPNGDRPQR
jgi:hypothetical protein